MNDVEKIDDVVEDNKNMVPSFEQLQHKMMESFQMVDDVVFRRYLKKLSECEVIAPDVDEKQLSDDISNIRIYRITEMVYQNHENSVHKLATVFSALQGLNCTVFTIVDSDGKKTEFYFGVRLLDDANASVSTYGEILKNSLTGEFPGTKVDDLYDEDIKSLITNINGNEDIASVSCVAGSKHKESFDNREYIQGLEKLALTMHGKKYTAIIVAQATSREAIDSCRRAYEEIYMHLSPFLSTQVSYGHNESIGISNAKTHTFSNATTKGNSQSVQTGENTTEGLNLQVSKQEGRQESETNSGLLGNIVKSISNIGIAGSGISAWYAAGMAGVMGVMPYMALGYVGMKLVDAFQITSVTSGASVSQGTGISSNMAKTITASKTITNNSAATATTTEGITQNKTSTTGNTNNLQLNVQNRTLRTLLDKIDKQLSRIDECENLGMWSCAAYFFGNMETAEMAACTYQSLMKGETSGSEISAINCWDCNNKHTTAVKNYVSHFIHPLFRRTNSYVIPAVMAAIPISGNELAYHMGLPKKSINGFPVIEHAEFGKSIVKYDIYQKSRDVRLGNIFSMGLTLDDFSIDIDSLTMHMFITGSTGAGKSNVIFNLMEKVRDKGIPFLVIEPAKGEYKNVFGNKEGVTVFGTNEGISPLLKINPFSFYKGIHVYEHIERMIEIFNACWPMYAAMPAVLKNAIEKAYEDCGWDLTSSTNEFGDYLFPSFDDVAKNVKKIIDASDYDVLNKGAYKGALLTRLQSLTNGVNGLIFDGKEISGDDLFDKSVIVDLSRLGSSETKSLIMGMLILKLNEYRMSLCKKMNSSLKHLVIIEEAHNLLKKVDGIGNGEQGNLQGKSVEMLANSIAEMRTYGEGFVIADQAPGLLDKAVIRNTNTKFIMRLPDYEDRELVGRSANLNDEQIVELAKLPRGVAAVYQNNWAQPILCKIDKFPDADDNYNYEPKSGKRNSGYSEIIFDVLNGIVECDREISVEKIKREMNSANVGASTQVRVLKMYGNRFDIESFGCVVSELFPTIYKCLRESYESSIIPSDWTKLAGVKLDHFAFGKLSSKAMKMVIYGMVVQYLGNELGKTEDVEVWRQEGGMRGDY